ncbi:MAG: DUF2807 domain-containing protein [Sphingomicrobium sp.]
MKKQVITLALLSSALAGPASAAPVERNYGVSGFDRVRVDGDYKVVLTNGVAPFAKAKGSARAIDAVAMRVEGRTLVIGMNRSAGWGGYPGESAGPVEISVGTHELTALWVNGGGAISINQVRGLSFEATAQGAGMISIDQMDVDQFKLALAGAATARLGGRAAMTTVIIRGSSLLDGETLAVKDATIGAQGPAIVKLAVSGTAKIDAIGVSSITLTGNPACTVKTQGSASVTGCKVSRF